MISISGYAITTKNPFDDKQLEQKLKEIEKEQKMKYAEMFWKQRQFFIENAFDDDDKLRQVHVFVEIYGNPLNVV